MGQIRLDKYLSNAGCGTRTEVKQLLKKGLVAVNGETVVLPERKVDPEKDAVVCQGSRVCLEEYRYFMLNKPAGYLSATEDRHQPVVLDLIREARKEELFPVGRLDIDTEGLLLLTNDGALAHELLAPKKHVDKTYFAKILGEVTEKECRQFQEGLDIGEKKRTMPAKLVVKQVFQEKRSAVFGEETENENKAVCLSEVEVTIQEGKFHQVKRMFEAVDRKVLYLKRLSMGSLLLDETLQPGAYRSLTKEETEGLRRHVKREKSVNF